ncbi:FixH family protein [Afifella pfennigii]|uniref:FixH family protein n=1 Tax=Afifella pfennigii TaxID=209897 RepID=UPI00146FB343|nr:FixH family protein [Afifella pfennigii]
MKKTLRFLRVSSDNPFTGWHAFAVVTAFFGTIIVVNLAMAGFAVGTFPGLVVKNSYVASQQYNDWLAESRAQEERGWQAKFDARDGVVKVRLADRSGSPITGVDVSALIARASTAQEDRRVQLSFVEGIYQAPGVLDPGRWIVEITARSGEELVFRTTRPVMVAAKAQ